MSLLNLEFMDIILPGIGPFLTPKLHLKKRIHLIQPLGHSRSLIREFSEMRTIMTRSQNFKIGSTSK